MIENLHIPDMGKYDDKLKKINSNIANFVKKRNYVIDKKSIQDFNGLLTNLNNIVHNMYNLSEEEIKIVNEFTERLRRRGKKKENNH